MNNELIEKRTFSLTESVFAWLCYFAGYAFCRAFPVMEFPLGGFLFIVAVFTFTAIFLKIQKHKFRTWPTIVAASAIAISVSLLVSTNTFLYFWTFSYAMAAYCYFVYSVLGNNIKNDFSDFMLFDFFKAIIVLPFASISKLFLAMFTGKAKSSGKMIGKIFIGVGLTLIPTIVVIRLLSYDSNFLDLLAKIIDFDLKTIISHIGSLGFAIPIGMYLFGLYASSVENKGKETIKAEDCSKAYQSLKIAPKLTVITAVVPLVFIYVIFFISQWDYYISGFVGSLPDEFSYAEFAREGFFQLCIVSLINLLVIFAVVLFMRRNVAERSITLKIISIVFAICTFVLISTAIAKMLMYIDSYGLTPKRVYSTWFMIVIASIFIVIFICQFTKRIKAVAVSFSVCVVLLTVLSVINIDGLIASYNVNRYIDGSLKTVDMRAMDDLGDAAIPELVRLSEHLDNKYGTDISTEECGSEDETYQELHQKLHNAAFNFEYYRDEESIFAKNIPVLRAERALKRINLI